MRTLLRILPFLLALLPWRAPLAFEAFTVEEIRVEGNERIATGTVFTYLPIERGDRVDRRRIAEAIRALYATGFFDDVRMSREGGILVVQVRERPAIAKITLVGNKDIKSEDLLKGLKEIGLAEGETFDRLALDRVTQELTRQYNNRGKYNVAVKPQVKTLDRNRVEITIDIKEGKAARIKHINIVGNQVFSDEELRKVFELNTTNWLSWYRRDDQYSREKLSGDLENLASYYFDRGYVDFNVESTQVSISPDRREMYIVINVREGELYRFGQIRLTGELILPEEDLRMLLIPKEGEVFSRQQTESTAEAMEIVLANIGYAFAEVTPIPEIDREARKVDVTFLVQPGKRVYVRRIVFRGNQRTDSEVLRRELRQYEGAWYSQAAVDRSKTRLLLTGFFSKVDIETARVPGTEDQVDLEVIVEERQSGQFQIAAGYSQFAGVILSFSISQNNFLGSGKRVALTAQTNRYVKRLDAVYVDPYFTEDGVSLGHRINYRELDESQRNLAAYTSDIAEYRLLLGVPLHRIRHGELQSRHRQAFHRGAARNRPRPHRRFHRAHRAQDLQRLARRSGLGARQPQPALQPHARRLSAPRTRSDAPGLDRGVLPPELRDLSLLSAHRQPDVLHPIRARLRRWLRQERRTAFLREFRRRRRAFGARLRGQHLGTGRLLRT